MSALPLAGAFVRAHEGCRLAAYPDSGGVWTIGWGHAGTAVHEGLTWTQSQADAQLDADLAHASDAVARLKKRLLADQQAAALISFVFNLGEGALASSTLLKLINDGRWLDATKEFLRFDHAGGNESKGLLIRRLDEAALFLKGS
ncbi:MAG TPA: lysozyme [Rhizomicrobium sp.]|jgi:lysozyme|nr:lysozyme [Rhizomicrobium sp.]